jgi:hypothetical protein
MASIIKVNDIQNTSGANIINESSNTITIGASGDTVAVPSGATFDVSNATVNGISAGITNAQLFRITTNFTGAQVITSNWEEADTDDAGSIGSFVSQSSGIFSFSQTGIYLIYFQVAVYEDADQRLFQIQIQSTPDNSTYGESATGYTFLSAQFPDICFSTMQTQFIFDCADTTNDKIRFYTGVGSGTTNIGDSNSNKTFASFIRLGDT